MPLEPSFQGTRTHGEHRRTEKCEEVALLGEIEDITEKTVSAVYQLSYEGWRQVIGRGSAI